MEVDVNKIQQESGQSFEDLDSLKDYLSKTDEVNSSDIGMLSEGYTAGETLIPNLTIGVLPLLELIESPFVVSCGEHYEFTRMDFIKAIYVIYKGHGAVRPLMGLAQRKSKLKALEADARKSPELYKVYLDKIDEISIVYSEFEDSAFVFSETIQISDWVEMEQTVTQMFTDLYDVIAELAAPDSTEKKTLLTANG